MGKHRNSDGHKDLVSVVDTANVDFYSMRFDGPGSIMSPHHKYILDTHKHME
jgi:hypothetical protein